MENVKWNRCQTPLEELHLEDYPKEVQESFWDYLNNVPFIRWMVSSNRPLVSELPRDEYGRAIIDVTKPPILEGSDYFRQTALHWQEYGKYINLKPNANPNSEFGRWIREERRRGWDGYVNPNTGMWITGDYYWMLNYCPMHLVEKRNGMALRVVAPPRFWDGQFLVSHYFHQARLHGHHAAELASRGRGKTTLGAAMLTRRIIIGEGEENSEGVQCMVTAADRTKLMGTNQILDVFVDNIDFSAKHTQFASRRLKSSVQELYWEMGFKKSGSDVAYGSQNSVSGIISGVNQDKLNGSRGVLYLIEEAGIFKDLLSTYNMIRPSTEEGDDTYAEIICYGTAGDDMSDFTAFSEMIYSPDGYNMEALENVFDKEGQGRKKITMFYGAYLNYDASCIDKDGNSDVTKALLKICMDRYKVKYGSTDINTITKRISQYPITPQEAIIRSRNNLFPVTELNERLNQLDNDPNAFDDVYVGELVQNADGSVEFKPTGDLPIRDFPTKDNKVKGAIEIYEMPQKDSEGKVPRGRYIAGADPYDNDTADTMSLGSFFILDLWTDRLVMEYTGRPMFAEDYFEICRLGCLFYNATLLYENNKRGAYSHFSQRNCLYLLADTPEYLVDKQLVKSIGYGNARKGVTTTVPVKEYGLRILRDWLLKPVTKVEYAGEEEVEVTVPNLYNIRCRALLKELILFNPIINVDRIMAMCMLMLYREEKMILYQGDVRKAEQGSSGMEKDSYWEKNYPGKRGR